MAQLGRRFDATSFDTEQRDYAELPNGIYKLEVEASDIGPTKDNKGMILKTTMAVLEPEQYAKRKLFTTFNIENQSAEAQRIGNQQFAALCRAIGIDGVEDSEELHFKAFTARVALGKPSKDGKYPARAEIKTYYFPDNDNVPDPAIDETQPASATAAANDNRRPAANDNKVTAAKAASAGNGQRRPWGAK